MARLGLLPLEIEVGRWQGIPREERLCKLGCGVFTVGDLPHFLDGCAALTTDRVGSLSRYSAEAKSTGNLLFFWRAKANALERRWRERTQLLNGPRTEPENPADALDDAAQRAVGNVLHQHARTESAENTAKPKKKPHKSGKRAPLQSGQSRRPRG